MQIRCFVQSVPKVWLLRQLFIYLFFLQAFAYHCRDFIISYSLWTTMCTTYSSKMFNHFSISGMPYWRLIRALPIAIDGNTSMWRTLSCKPENQFNSILFQSLLASEIKRKNITFHHIKKKKKSSSIQNFGTPCIIGMLEEKDFPSSSAKRCDRSCNRPYILTIFYWSNTICFINTIQQPKANKTLINSESTKMS